MGNNQNGDLPSQQRITSWHNLATLKELCVAMWGDSVALVFRFGRCVVDGRGSFWEFPSLKPNDAALALPSGNQYRFLS